MQQIGKSALWRPKSANHRSGENKSNTKNKVRDKQTKGFFPQKESGVMIMAFSPAKGKKSAADYKKAGNVKAIYNTAQKTQ